MKNPLTDIQIRKLSEMQYKANTYRGMIIGYSTSIENKINQFISEYFVLDNSKRESFVAIFFSTNGLSFRHKQKTLMHILKTDNTFTSFLQNNPDFFTDLDKIISNRNDMAHSQLHTTKENINNFDGNNFQLHCYKVNNQGTYKSKLLEINFGQLIPTTDKIMALHSKIDDLLKCINSQP